MLWNCGAGEDSWVPWTARRSNQSILKEINPNIHWKDWCWSWSSNTLATQCEEPTHWKRPWCWERLRERGEGGNRGWDGWMASARQVECWGSKRKARKSSSGVVTGLRLKGWEEGEIGSTERKRGLCRALVGQGLSATGSVAPREGRRGGNTLIPHKPFLISPTNWKPEGSRACGCNFCRASWRAEGKWGMGLQGKWGLHSADSSELWLEIHSIWRRRCPVEGGSVWRQNEAVRPVEGSEWGENWLCWAGRTW